MTDSMPGSNRDGEDPWVTHWRWTAVDKGIVLADLRDMHQRETKGGVPTGRCLCGLSAPCPTAERIGAYTATLQDPCDCRLYLDGRCPQVGDGPAADAAS